MPNRMAAAARRRAKWWTRERVLLGLQRFHKDFGFCPTDQGKYAQYQQHTGRDPVTGKHSNLGWHQKYPSMATIFNFFASMRDAWTAAGFDVDRGHQEWSPIEDWFVLESVGVLHRDEVSEILKRTPAAVKRRLYDLGDVNVYNRWGITLTKAEKLLGLPAAVIRKYIDYGIIPCYRGVKLIYLNPADLLKVEEADWSKAVNPDLDRLIRAAIAQRIAKMAKFGTAWREHEIYRFHRTKTRYSGRVKKPRESAFARELPTPPNDLVVGEHCVTNKPLRRILRNVGDRIGIIKALHFSPQRQRRVDGSNRACWIARVDFPKIRKITGEKTTRIKHSIPLDCLERSTPIERPKRELKMNPEAVRSRRRFAKAKHRARGRFAEVAEELS